MDEINNVKASKNNEKSLFKDDIHNSRIVQAQAPSKNEKLKLISNISANITTYDSKNKGTTIISNNYDPRINDYQNNYIGAAPTFINSCKDTQNYVQNDSKIIADNFKEQTLENFAKSDDNLKNNPTILHNKMFSREEDEMLKRIVFRYGPKNWKYIASLMQNRTPRQCRDRYSNYLAPGFLHSNWSRKEDDLLAEKYLLYGPKWALMRSFFPSRTANDIKNRFNYTISKKINWYKKRFMKNNNSEKSIIDDNMKKGEETKVIPFLENEEFFDTNQDELFSDTEYFQSNENFFY